MRSAHSSFRVTVMADCANAAMTMTLVATSLGIGSCYIAGFNTVLRKPEGAEFCKRLKIPEGFTPLLGVCLGYVSEPPKQRKELRPNTVTFL